MPRTAATTYEQVVKFFKLKNDESRETYFNFLARDLGMRLSGKVRRVGRKKRAKAKAKPEPTARANAVEQPSKPRKVRAKKAKTTARGRPKRQEPEQVRPPVEEATA